ncbi:asparaginase [Diaminobutyricimonas sp. LJ205]|uniref:asparaginase n=1 Tax=Diaminobutyricimonas sp. LJ205 TaxID=2683590 RepID=UPI002106C475|nr:asparaginase [Diaminobutyricimonas sp. LJ205]
MTDVLTVSGAVELAVIERSGMIESRHIGAAVVVGPDAATLREVGDVDALIYPRSTLKPLQALAVLRSGVDLDGEELVLATASHAGTGDHVAVVQRMLAEAGLDDSALQCPADWPFDRDARDGMSAPTRLTMNCSGKHAAFLMACAANGWPTESYLAPEHPLQQRILATVEEFTGAGVEHSGIDGCGAPVHAVTLRGLATAISRVTGPADDADASRLAAAVRAHPWAIDGPGRANTVTIEKLGLIAKLGAEGVMVMGAPDGTAVAVKVLDGSLRAATAVALHLLVTAGAVDADAAAEVEAITTEPVLGGGRPVGALRVTLP